MVQGNGPNFANLVRLSWPFQRVSTVWPISAKVSPWWGKSTEHDQNAWNPKFDPFHYIKAASKLEKSTNCSHNLISSEGGQDTSACKNFRPFPQWVFQIPENAWGRRFLESLRDMGFIRYCRFVMCVMCLSNFHGGIIPLISARGSQVGEGGAKRPWLRTSAYFRHLLYSTLKILS